MEKIKERLSFFKKLSLVQQLIVVLCAMAILMVAVMMPVVDYNLSSIVDKQMYERLTISQTSIIYSNIIPYKQEKEVYHIIYESDENTFTETNISSHQVVYDFYSYLLKKIYLRLFKPIKASLKIKDNIMVIRIII